MIVQNSIRKIVIFNYYIICLIVRFYDSLSNCSFFESNQTGEISSISIPVYIEPAISVNKSSNHLPFLTNTHPFIHLASKFVQVFEIYTRMLYIEDFLERRKQKKTYIFHIIFEKINKFFCQYFK